MVDEISRQIFFSQWRVIVIVSVLLLAAAETGFRFGLRLHRAKDEARKSQIITVQAAVLGLAGLLLGFTFSIAVGRYESRRDLVLSEANAIGTTYLRASLLPGTQPAEVRILLRRYVDARLDFYSTGEDETKLAAAQKESAALQQQLWDHAAAAAQMNPTPITSTFVLSLNETIDLGSAHTHALRTRVPGTVWLLVLVVAACGCGTTGYVAGASGKRSGIADIGLPLLIALAITILADIDRPRGGMILISQQALLDLKSSLAHPDIP